MRKKRKMRFSGTYPDGRQAHRSFILPLPQRGSQLWRQKLLLLLRQQRLQKATEIYSQHLLPLPHPERGTAIAPSHRKEEEEKQAPKGSRAATAAAAAGTGREAQRQRSGRVAKESSKSSQSRAAGRTAGHRLARQLHSDGSSYLFIKRRTTGPGENPSRSRSGRR
jgi:hypothetical protein